MTDRTRTIARAVALAAIPVLATLVAWALTSRNAQEAGGEVTAAAPVHQHGANANVAEGQPVMLSAEQALRIGVTYDSALVAPLAREVRTVGQVTYDERRVQSIAPRVDGYVERLIVNYTGQSVRAGEPLLAIYSPMLVAAQEELLLAKRLATDVGNADAEARSNAESLLASARKRLAYWDVSPADIDRIESTGQVQRTITLRSSASGFVIEKNVVQGQRIMAGESLYRVVDLTDVWVEGDVFERDLPSVRVGQQVRVELDALAGQSRAGRVTYVYPTLDTETRTARVRVELSNASLQLKPGMYATLRWQGSGAMTLSVPRTAVLSTGERNLVFVRRADGMLEPRVVTVGATSTERMEILSGLTAGETVVKSATFLVDAESNLGTLLGGMGDMPGMDITAPKQTTREDHSAHQNH